MRRALRSKIRVSEEHYQNGDHVFYKRGVEKWLGPGKDGKIIFIRYGGTFVRVSPNQIVCAKESLTDLSDDLMDTVNGKDNPPSLCQHDCRQSSEIPLLRETIGESHQNKVNNPPVNQEHRVVMPEPQPVIKSLKKDDLIKFKQDGDIEWKSARVLG